MFLFELIRVGRGDSQGFNRLVSLDDQNYIQLTTNYTNNIIIICHIASIALDDKYEIVFPLKDGRVVGKPDK